jgi:outer membrane protein TolC
LYLKLIKNEEDNSINFVGNNDVPCIFAGSLYLAAVQRLVARKQRESKKQSLGSRDGRTGKERSVYQIFPVGKRDGMGLVSEKAMFNIETEQGEVGMFKNEMISAVSASQPVFAGGQIVNGNKLAQVGVEASKLQKQLSDDEVVLQTECYYWQLVSMKEKVKTIEVVETMLVRIHNDVSVSLEAGLITKNDLLRVELEQNKLSAGKLKLVNGVQTLKSALGQHIGLSPDAFEVEFPLFEVETGHTPSLQNRAEHEAVLSQRAEY